MKGVTYIQLNSAAEILDSLRNGALNRTTAATNMNQQSSRSHAIFSVVIKQQRMVSVDVSISNFTILYYFFNYLE